MSPDAFNPFALSSVSVLSALSPQNPHPGRSFPLLSVLALELPPDLAYNETIVTLTGQTEAVIENYKSVFKYTPSEIVIQSFCGKVTISGKNLEIRWYNSSAMKVTGSIYDIKAGDSEC